ncbi:uncharacterized protein LOC113666820 isoform X2 [Pocillopora damicornis]|uniref:uncharacterized protein LOC113666820 isoform X2 n=1 Tax=Pocillopora damicornis TaxID=46731 RepID=UPI000F558272|nr:uncharacterized protein LOC113666820 isoform X2 [Pocillopora damicornis]
MHSFVKNRFKLMDIFWTFLPLVALSDPSFAVLIEMERLPSFPTDDFLLPDSLCPSFRPSCSLFKAHPLGGCWCSCPNTFSFYEEDFQCEQNSEARRNAGCDLLFADETDDNSLPFFPSGSVRQKTINVPANQNCSFYFKDEVHVNYLRCDGTWKLENVADTIDLTSGWSISQLSIKLKSGLTMPQSFAGRLVRVAVQCGARNSDSPFKTTCVLFKVQGINSCSYPQSTPSPSQAIATLPTPISRPKKPTTQPTTKPTTQPTTLPTLNPTQIESSPIFCDESGKIEIQQQTYWAKCFFFCCRDCNKEFYDCYNTSHRSYCLGLAFSCAEKCARDSSLSITVKGMQFLR